jgi:hypothetical protein
LKGTKGKEERKKVVEGKRKTRTLFDDAESDAGSIGYERWEAEEGKMTLVRDRPGRGETGSRARD